MQRPSACPDPDSLRQLTLGNPAPEERERFARHLEQCSPCADTVEQLLMGDTLTGAVQKQVECAPGDDRVVEQLIRRLEAEPRPDGGDSSGAADPPGAATDAATLESLRAILSPAESPDELGRLGPYRVLRVLGAGGMGIVLQAEDPQLRRTVALKIMKPALAANESARQRFLREARAAAAIEHDHIVTIYQVGEDRSIPFIAMQWLVGETLEERLKGMPRLLLRDLLHIGAEMASGLAAAHERRLIHRDIKPANIWLEAGRDRVKILDFGLARAADDESNLTQMGAIAGTPAFMAPEQAGGEPVDHRSDLFSLGCVLYRMITGELPFRGETTMAVLMAVGQHQPPAPIELDPSVPRALSDLVMRLMAKRPSDRPESAGVVAEALEAMARGAEPDRSVLSAAPAVDRALPRGSRRRAVLGAAAALLALAAGWYFAPHVVRIVTDRGELVVQSDDPAVELQIRREAVRVVDRGGGRTYDLAVGSRDLKSGDYRIEIAEESGLRVDSPEFHVERNGRTVVRAWLERPAVRPSTESTVAARGEESSVPPLAEWLEGREILTVAQDGSGMYRTIQSALEALKPGQVVKILDRGPYRERLDAWLPEDVGVVSDVSTRIEWTGWRNDGSHPQDPKRSWYMGVSFGLRGEGGLRLSGLEFAGPDIPADAWDVRLLSVGAVGRVVIESCRALRTPEYEPIAPKVAAFGAPFSWIRIVQEPHPRGAELFLIGNEFQVGVNLEGLRGRVVVERNLILACKEHTLMLDDLAAAATVRHNVLMGHPMIWRIFKPATDWSTAADELAITNNTFECVGSPISFWHKEPGSREIPLIPRRAAFRNNVIRWSGTYNAPIPQFRSQVDREYAEANWSIGNNCYADEPASDVNTEVRRYLARQPSDVVQQSPFLSVDPRAADYLRVPADSPLATGGTGLILPGYMGAVPPGPAPEGGDWLTRILDRRRTDLPDRRWSLAVAVPAPVEEWLKGREQLKVAQDGSAQFRTIQEALDVLKPGQAVVVLDKGPYRERIINKNSPADVGLVSLVGTRIEIPAWEPSNSKTNLISWSLFYPNGLRLSGFDIVCPEFPAETRVAWPIGVEGAEDLVIENCRILATPRTPSEASSEDPMRDRLVALYFLRDRLPVDAATRVYVRDCMFDGALNFHPSFQASIAVERNLFVSSRVDSIVLPMRAEHVVIARNVLMNRGGIWIQRFKSRGDVKDPSTEIAITNNLFDVEAHAIRLVAAERNDEPSDVRAPGDVRIVNNIVRSRQGRGIAVPTRDLEDVQARWRVGPNAYASEPGSAEPSIVMLPPRTGDVVAPPNFLSVDPIDRNYLRIDVAGPWATEGDASSPQRYFGPFEPGPAPAAGDWCTRLRRPVPALVLAAHQHQLNPVAISSDGKRALTGGLFDMTLKLWDLETGAMIRSFEGHTGGVWAAALSPVGRYALSGAGDVWKDGRWQPGGDYEIRLWDVATGQTKLRFGGHTQHVMSVAFSPDGGRAVSGSYDSTIRVWDVATGAELRRIKTRGRVVSVAFAPDGGAVVSGSDDGSVRLWDAATGEQLHRYDGHSGSIFQVGFAADGHRVFTSAHDNTARIFDRDTEKELARVALETPAGGVFSGDGRLLVTAWTDGVVRLWDVAKSREIETYSEHTTAVIRMAVSIDGSRIVSGDGQGRVMVWDVPPGLPLERGEVRRLAGHTGAVLNFALCRHGTRMLTSSADKTVRLWDVPSGKELRRFEGHDGEVWGVAMSPDCRTALSAGYDKSIRLWDLATEKEIRRFEGVSEIVSSVAFSADGKRAISSGPDKVIRIWDVETGREAGQLEGHTAWPASAVFSPRGDRILSASDDQTVRLWDAGSGKELRQFVGHSGHVQSAAFAPRGSHVLSGSKDHTVRLWDLDAGNEIRRMVGHSGEIWSVAFAPNGRHAISGSSDKSIRIWDVESGAEVHRFGGHNGVIWRVGFSSDARYAISAGSDAIVRLWQLPDSIRNQRIQPLVARRLGDAISLQSLISTCVFTADGKRVVVVTGSTGPGTRDRTTSVATHAVGDGKQIGEPLELKGVLQRVLSPDGSRLVVTVGSPPETSVQLWDVAERKQIGTLVETSGTIPGVPSFSADGSRVALGHSEGWARVWDAATARPVIDRLVHDQSVMSLALSNDGRVLATISGDAGRGATSPTAVRLWNAADGTPIGAPLATEGRVNRLEFSQDGKILLTGVVPRTISSFTSERSEPAELRCWDTGSAQPLGELWRLAVGDALLAVAPDGRTIAIAHADRSVRLWDAVRREPAGPRIEIGKPLRLARLSPDGRLLLTASVRTTSLGDSRDFGSGRTVTSVLDMQVWDAQSGELSATIPVPSAARETGRESPSGRFGGSGPSFLISAVFSPDARAVLVTNSSGAQIWALP